MTAHKAKKVTLAKLVPLDLREKQDPEALKARGGLRVKRVNLVRKVTKATLVSRASKASPEKRAKREIKEIRERKASKEKRVIRAILALRDPRDLKEKQDPQVRMGHKAPQANPVSTLEPTHPPREQRSGSTLTA